MYGNDGRGDKDWPRLMEVLSKAQPTDNRVKRLEDLYHGRLARWIKWRACDVREAKGGLENELWRRWSNGRIGELAMTWVKWQSLKNELWRRWGEGKAHSPTLSSLHLRHSSFSNPRVRKSRYWRETHQVPHPLLWGNEASLLVQWRTMYFPLAL